MSGGFTFVEGGPFQGPDDVIIDEFYAEQKQEARRRHRRDCSTADWHVAGIVAGGKLAHIVVPLKTLQELDQAVTERSVRST